MIKRTKQSLFLYKLKFEEGGLTSKEMMELMHQDRFNIRSIAMHLYRRNLIQKPEIIKYPGINRGVLKFKINKNGMNRINSLLSEIRGIRR